MTTKKRAERKGQAKAKTKKASENSKGGGYIDAKDARSETGRKKKGKSNENVRMPINPAE